MYKLVIVLALCLAGGISQAAEVCLQGTISGQKDLARPWPLQIHGERHTQIQRAISAHSRNAQYCLERFGDLPGPIQFSIPANGVIEVEDSSIKSPAGECIAKMLRVVRVADYSCDMNVTYKWDGKFPLVNAERIEFR